jgi:hypothetical protein
VLSDNMPLSSSHAAADVLTAVAPPLLSEAAVVPPPLPPPAAATDAPLGSPSAASAASGSVSGRGFAASGVNDAADAIAAPPPLPSRGAGVPRMPPLADDATAAALDGSAAAMRGFAASGALHDAAGAGTAALSWGGGAPVPALQDATSHDPRFADRSAAAAVAAAADFAVSIERVAASSRATEADAAALAAPRRRRSRASIPDTTSSDSGGGVGTPAAAALQPPSAAPGDTPGAALGAPGLSDYVHVLGAKDADGHPLLDPRTVAFLVRIGVLPDEAAVRALLQRKAGGAPRRLRYPLEAVTQAHAWLRGVLDGVVKRAPRSATERRSTHMDVPIEGVAHVIRKWPATLTIPVEKLAHRWQLLQAPRPGGLGLSRKQAEGVVLDFPQLFGLTAARVLECAERLLRLGVADADVPRVLARHMPLLSLSAASMDAKVALLRAHSLDVGPIITAQPHLLSCSVANLGEKLDFVFRVAGCSVEDVQRNPILLMLGLRTRTRPRFFLAAQLGALPRYKLATCVQPKDEAFLRRVLRGTQAEEWSVAHFRAHVAAPEFVAWAAAHEAELRARLLQERAAGSTHTQ